MTKIELAEKYSEVLKEMEANGEQGDKFVLLDKLIYMARKEEGAEGDTYFVPEGFDKEAFLADVALLG